MIGETDDLDPSCRRVLEQLLLVHILKFFEVHLPSLFEGNYTRDGQVNHWMQTRLLALCEQLRTEVAALVDVFAPPDHILNSVLGKENGQVYQAIEQTLRNNPHTFLTPPWVIHKERSQL